MVTQFPYVHEAITISSSTLHVLPSTNFSIICVYSLMNDSIAGRRGVNVTWENSIAHTNNKPSFLLQVHHLYALLGISR